MRYPTNVLSDILIFVMSRDMFLLIGGFRWHMDTILGGIVKHLPGVIEKGINKVNTMWLSILYFRWKV